jgi:predicted PurR-regulated permease PerM
MKVKLLNVLTVSLVTLALISPGVIVFAIVWGQHREFVKTQNLSCELQKINIASPKSIPQTQIINTQSSLVQVKSSNSNFLNQLQMAAKKYKLATILQWLFLVTPICIGIGIIAYDRYLVYRAAVLKEHIAMLERMWQQSIEQ